MIAFPRIRVSVAILLALSVTGLSAVIAEGDHKPSAGDVALTPVKWDAYLAKIASHKKAKLVMVDAWATWCGPCKENFPHVVEMHKKYAEKGLIVVSLSLDDTEKPKKLNEALDFLKQKKAVFTNLVLDEAQDVAFEKLNVSAIPAVFLYSPDGKEIKRFTMDDPNNQFTYEDVEKTVTRFLESGKLANK